MLASVVFRIPRKANAQLSWARSNASRESRYGGLWTEAPVRGYQAIKAPLVNHDRHVDH